MTTERLEYWVEEIVSPDTLRVSPGWEYEGHRGWMIKIRGIKVPAAGTAPFKGMKEALADLLLGHTVTVSEPFALARDGALICEVYSGPKPVRLLVADPRTPA